LFSKRAVRPESPGTHHSDFSPEEDHLSLAAEARRAVAVAVESEDFDEAWRLLHLVKHHYALHAAESGFTASQLRTLDGSVHEDLANVLHLEGRDDEALIQIIYWVATSEKSISRHDRKISAYFTRCNFNNVQLDEIEAFVSSVKSNPDFRLIDHQVRKWSEGSGVPSDRTPESVSPTSPESSGKSPTSEDPNTAAARRVIQILSQEKSLSTSELATLRRRHEEATRIDFCLPDDVNLKKIEEMQEANEKRLRNSPAHQLSAKLSGDQSDNLELQSLQIFEAFEFYLETGESPAPHSAWRIAVILRKMKESELENEFLANWAKHFGERGGSATYDKLIDRYEKLCD
jgi:hypothetical protein